MNGEAKREARGILGWVLAPSNPWKLASVLTFPLIVILGLLVAMLLGWQQRSLEDIQMVGLREVGRTFFEHLRATRIWVGGHGGLYLEVPEYQAGRNGVPDVNDITILGKTYRRVGEGPVTPELLRGAEQRGLYTFRVTSLRPTTRHSHPDAWEADALRSFLSGGSSEVTAIVDRGDQRFFRYIAPLVLEESCMECHQRTPLEVGAVRGGLSVEIPLTASDNEYARQVKASAMRFGALGVVAILVVVVIMAFLSFRISEGFLDKLRQESALRNLNELLSEISVRDKKILENVHDGIAVIDPRGVLELVNTFLLGFDPLTERQVIGRRIDEIPRHTVLYRVLVPPGEEGAAVAAADCELAGAGGEVRTDGQRCWTRIGIGERAEVKCRPCPAYRRNQAALEEPQELVLAGKVFTVSSVFVSDQKTGEFYCELRVLHDATREKLSAVLELAGAAAHNFRQPLAVILSLRELIGRKIGDGEGVAQELVMLEEQCIRLDEILKKMLRITTYRQKEYLDDLKILDLDTSGPETDPPETA